MPLSSSELANAVLRLHETVLANSHRDVKYVLQHNDTGRPIIVKPEAVVKEMGSGNYFNWMGPFEEAWEMDHKVVREELVRSKTVVPRERTMDAIWVQAMGVAKEHGIGLKI